MAVKEAEPVSSHFPRLLDDLGYRRPDEISRAMTVQVDLDELRAEWVN